MKKNEEYVVQCIDETNQGYGIVKIEDQVVFVPDLMQSEKACIKIVKVQKNFSFGKIMKLIEPSFDRIEPECKVSKLCGGCQYQHVSYAAQLKTKHRLLEERVHRKIKYLEVRPVLGMDHPYYYRNKAQFPVQIHGDRVVMGFYRRHSNDIVPCAECKIQAKRINEIYQYLQSHLSVALASGLRHILMRHSEITGETQVVFIGSKRNAFEPLVNELIHVFPDIQSIVFNENKRKDNVILGEAYEVLYGRDFIYESCLGNTVKLHFKSFFQVNPKQMEVLYQQAIDAGKLSSNMTCIEMYSGVGTIGMAVSKYVKQVIGVEIVKEAVDNAIENCALNGITNCSYACMDASVFASQFKASEKKVDVVFVDPPRKGMTQEGIKDITSMQPDRVVYVSCNPETLIRDLCLFEACGYRCEYMQPVDMFCQTTGLENICLISREV